MLVTYCHMLSHNAISSGLRPSSPSYIPLILLSSCVFLRLISYPSLSSPSVSFQTCNNLTFCSRVSLGCVAPQATNIGQNRTEGTPLHARNSGSAIIWRWHAPSILCSKFCHTNSIRPLVMSTNRQPHVDQLDLDENSSPAGSTPASRSCCSPSTSSTQSGMPPTGSPPNFSLYNRYYSLRLGIQYPLQLAIKKL